MGDNWIIFDLGGSQTRVGLIDDGAKPRATFPSCIGAQADSDFISFADNCKPGSTLYYPFKKGRAPTSSDWQSKVGGNPNYSADTVIEEFFQYAIMNELREDPMENQLLIIANEPNWTKELKSHVCDILFPNLEFPGIAFAPSSTCCLAAKEKMLNEGTCLVIDIGDSGFRVNSVQQGRIIESAQGTAGGNEIKNTPGTPPLDVLFPSLAQSVVSVLTKGGPVDYVLLCGGVSATDGLKERLFSEVKALGKPLDSIECDIDANPNLSFHGATIILGLGIDETAVPGDYTNIDLAF